MAQFVVGHLEDDVRDKLRAMADAHGQSLEDMVREILQTAVMSPRPSKPGLGTRFANRFAGQPVDHDIDELRGQSFEPPSFDP